MAKDVDDMAWEQITARILGREPPIVTAQPAEILLARNKAKQGKIRFRGMPPLPGRQLPEKGNG